MKHLCAMVSIVAIIPLSAMSSPKSESVRTIELTEKQDGGTVKAKVNSTIVVRLKAQLGTGYGWQVERPSRGVRLESQTQERPSAKQTTGGTDVQVFHFTLTAKGKHSLHFVYRQPWSGGATGRSLHFTVTAQ